MSTTEFWVVWNPYRGLPQVRHDTQAAAEAEADRLATKHPGDEFVILRAESVTKVELPKPYRFKLGQAWIPWIGGVRPISQGTTFRVKYRYGEVSGVYHNAEALRWWHSGEGGDIVAYQVVE